MGQNQAIRQRISLEGGATIKAQLEAIGTAGKKAFTDLQNAVASSRFANIGAAIDSIKAKTAELGTAGRRVAGDWNNVTGAFRNTASSIAITVGVVGAAVAGFAAFVLKGGNVVDTLEKVSAELGTTTQKFENMRNAAEQVGVDEDELTKALRALRNEQQKAAQTSDGFAKKQEQLRREFARGNVTFDGYLEGMRKIRDESNDSETAFTRLGVSILNADGSLKNITDLRDDVADSLKGISDETERSARAFDLLGTRNAKTLTFFSRGAEAIRGMEREAERVARPLTELQKIAIGLADNGFKSLRRAIDSVTNGLRATFAPEQGRIFDALTEAVVRNRAAFLEYASTIASKVKPIITDIIALIDGRDGDVKNTFILKARDAIIDFANGAKKAVTEIILPALAGLLKVLDIVAGAINGLFGTKLTGSQIAFALIITKIIGLFGLFAGVVKLALSAVALLATVLGGPVALAVAAVAFAIGFVLVRALQSVNWKTISDSAALAWATIKNAVTTVGAFIVGAFNTTLQFVTDAWNGFVQFFANIGTAVGNSFNLAAITISNAFLTCVNFVTDLWNGLLAFFANLPAVVAGFFTSVGESIKNAFFDAVNAVKGFVDDLWRKITSVFNSIIAAAQRVASAVRDAVSGGGGDGAGAQGFAGGGAVRGPGTSRSDSILALLSDGEFVLNARAVAHWGLARLHAMNNLRMPQFNAGGFVDSMTAVSPGGGIPRFANGGLAMASASGGSTPVHLHFPGGTIGPVMADRDVMKALRRMAVSDRTASAGKKPGFVGA